MGRAPPHRHPADRSGPLIVAVIAAIAAAPPHDSGLTVVTNCLDAAVHLARVPTLTVYNIGDTVFRASRAQEGDWAIEGLSRLRVDVAVLSPRRSQRRARSERVDPRGCRDFASCRCLLRPSDRGLPQQHGGPTELRQIRRIIGNR